MTFSKANLVLEVSRLQVDHDSVLAILKSCIRSIENFIDYRFLLESLIRNINQSREIVNWWLCCNIVGIEKGGWELRQIENHSLNDNAWQFLSRVAHEKYCVYVCIFRPSYITSVSTLINSIGTLHHITSHQRRQTLLQQTIPPSPSPLSL